MYMITVPGQTSELSCYCRHTVHCAVILAGFLLIASSTPHHIPEPWSLSPLSQLPHIWAEGVLGRPFNASRTREKHRPLPWLIITLLVTVGDSGLAQGQSHAKHQLHRLEVLSIFKTVPCPPRSP